LEGSINEPVLVINFSKMAQRQQAENKVTRGLSDLAGRSEGKPV